MLKIYSALCLFVLSFLLFPSETHAQCTNNQSFPAAVSAPTNATVLTISSAQTMTQFTQINGLVAGNRYVLTHSGSNAFVTVRFNTSSGTVVAAGLSPLQFTATCNGNYYVHWNSGTACATSATTGVSTISCVGCGALNSAQCQFSNIFGSATAPTSGSVNFTTCAWGGEYSPLNNVQALTVYRLSSSNLTDFVTGYNRRTCYCFRLHAAYFYLYHFGRIFLPLEYQFGMWHPKYMSDYHHNLRICRSLYCMSECTKSWKFARNLYSSPCWRNNHTLTSVARICSLNLPMAKCSILIGSLDEHNRCYFFNISTHIFNCCLVEMSGDMWFRFFL
jgi:hypothetical protein